MTRVLVDLQFMTGSKGGMETYVRETYARISDFVPEIDFVGLSSRASAQSCAEWFPGKMFVSGDSGNSRVKLAFNQSFRVTRFAKKLGANLIHSPANFGPWTKEIPSIVTVHDVLSFSRPEFVPGHYAFLIRRLLKNSVNAAIRILTDSFASAEDIEKYLGVPKNRISVIPLAANTENRVVRISDKGTAFFLAVGNNLPHKNFDFLLKAWGEFPEISRPRLILVGGNAEPLRDKIRSLRLMNWVEHKGWVSKYELEQLYAEARGLLFPTSFEGFGLPVLEAMQRGCPVICNDLPVLREVAGDAALYFDNTDPSSMIRRIDALLGSSSLINELSRKSLVQSKKFEWSKTASQTALAFRSVIDELGLAYQSRRS